MKVWLVVEDLEYEGERVVAAYSSLESAHAHIDRAGVKTYAGRLEVQEYDVAD